MGFPISYRQVHNPPSIQFSMDEDGSRADVDVDYRSSKTPQAMWNGHLTSANSDIRAGKNYAIHKRQWSGLINWWTSLFGELPDQHTDRTDLFHEPPEPPIPLPPNRPLGAAMPELHDAMEEFLADWLVRRNIDEAMEFVSPNALACVNIDEDAENEILSAAQAQAELRREMRQIAEAMGHPHNLTEVIDELRPWREALRVMSHPFEKDFTIIEVPDTFSKAFRCESRSEEEQRRALTGTNLQYGNYFGTLFRTKVEGNQGGALGLLWTKESGAWRIVSWEAYAQ